MATILATLALSHHRMAALRHQLRYLLKHFRRQLTHVVHHRLMPIACVVPYVGVTQDRHAVSDLDPFGYGEAMEEQRIATLVKIAEDANGFAVPGRRQERVQLRKAVRKRSSDNSEDCAIRSPAKLFRPNPGFAPRSRSRR